MDTELFFHTTALTSGAQAPEWIQLAPAGEFTGEDGRGPYQANDIAAIIAASMQPGRKLPIDENHSIDLNAPKGASTPARGWIVAMEARDGGIWGKVEWTEEGQRIVAGREYGFISPALMCTKTKPHKVMRILRASLTNEPNLTMQSLHNKDATMDKELRALLGLDDSADQKAIVAAVKKQGEGATALGTSLNTVKKALGLDDNAEGDALVTALNSKLTAQAQSINDDPDDLKGQIKTLQNQLTELTNNTGKAAATSIVDAAIAGLKLVPALRDHYIARHIKNPSEVEAELKLMPSLHGAGLGKRNPAQSQDGALDDVDASICALMGLDPKAYAETKKTLEKEFV